MITTSRPKTIPFLEYNSTLKRTSLNGAKKNQKFLIPGTVGENIICAPKYEINFGALSKCILL